MATLSRSGICRAAPVAASTFASVAMQSIFVLQPLSVLLDVVLTELDRNSRPMLSALDKPLSRIVKPLPIPCHWSAQLAVNPPFPWLDKPRQTLVGACCKSSLIFPSKRVSNTSFRWLSARHVSYGLVRSGQQRRSPRTKWHPSKERARRTRELLRSRSCAVGAVLMAG